MKEPENDILKQNGFENDEQLKEALSMINKLKPEKALSKEEAWSRFEKTVNLKENVETQNKKFSIGIIYRIAATIIVIIGLWLGFRTWNNVYIATYNSQTESIYLPDKSHITLNASSTIKYKRLNWKNSRKVELTGEALFKVKKGSSFKVSASGRKITVLGTEFNVFSRKDFFEVKCLSGKVEVKIPNNESVTLNKGNAIKQESDKPPVKYEIKNEDASWTKGEFYYNDADLKLVMGEISRQFNVKISGDITNRRYSGYFNKSKLNEALDNVCIPLGLNYTITKESVTIRQGN
jgi:ferric-dicitrate binding protein FerR (iron transport regulator)